MKKFIILIVFNCFLLNGYSRNQTNNPVEISFARRIMAADLQIKRLTAIVVNDSILFTLTYSSKKDRNLSFFNPPQGNVIKYIDSNGLRKDDTIITFCIEKDIFKSISDITMRFSTKNVFETDRNFIFLNTSKPSVKNFLGLSNKRAESNFVSRIFPFPYTLITYIALCFLVPILLILAQKTNSYTSAIEKRIKNKWLTYNIKVFLFSIVIILVILFVTGSMKASLTITVYLNLLIIVMFPANLVYLFENIIFKGNKLFWLWQYLNLFFFIVGLIFTYQICDEITNRIISRKIIAIEYVILCGILIGFVRLINNYISYQKIGSLKEKELEILRLKELKVRSDLNALQSKINPHFLYNALNSIAELCWEDPQKTERMALSLSKLFRYSINKEESDFNFLKNEIEIVGLYLCIEKERFGDKLNYQFHYSSDIENTLIPKFILQPLIENAIKHGISKKPEGGCIKLTIIKIENQLEIKVYDNGPDFPVNLISGYGLQSIYDKLDILYPNRYTIELHNGIDKNVTIILKNDTKINRN